MPLILSCVPVVHEFSCCFCCRFSLKTSTKVIGWIFLVISLGLSSWHVVRLTQYEESEFRKPTKVSERKEFLIFELVSVMTMATLSFLLLLGVHCGVPLLMLPYLLIQLPLITVHMLVRMLLAITSARSNINYGMMLAMVCALLIGILTHLWVTQYNCYRQFVEKRHCTCGKASKAAPQSMVRGSLHLEEAVQNDYSALTAAFTMYALSMMNNENSHPQG